MLLSLVASEAEAEQGERIAEGSRWSPDGNEAFEITYYPTVAGFGPPWSVKLPVAWNKMLDEFIVALRNRRRRHGNASHPA
jgi:hypothetical protein